MAKAEAGVLDYPDGSNNSNAIILVDNTTQLQVLSGAAIQSGQISELGGSFGLQKTGGGILTVSGTNTYSGGTTVADGTLDVEGLNASSVVVQALGALEGRGQRRRC